MVESLTNSGTKKVFIGTNHLVTKGFDALDNPGLYAKNAKHYNELIRSLESKYPQKVLVVDIEKFFSFSFEKESEYLLDDGVHLNETGHQIFADIAIENLKPILNSFKHS